MVAYEMTIGFFIVGLVLRRDRRRKRLERLQAEDAARPRGPWDV